MILFGLPQDVMVSLAHNAVKLIMNGNKLESGNEYSDFIANFPIKVDDVHKSQLSNYLNGAVWYYESHRNFNAVQLIWPDANGIFPGEEGFDIRFNNAQPLLNQKTIQL